MPHIRKSALFLIAALLLQQINLANAAPPSLLRPLASAENGRNLKKIPDPSRQAKPKPKKLMKPFVVLGSIKLGMDPLADLKEIFRIIFVIALEKEINNKEKERIIERLDDIIGLDESAELRAATEKRLTDEKVVLPTEAERQVFRAKAISHERYLVAISEARVAKKRYHEVFLSYFYSWGYSFSEPQSYNDKKDYVDINETAQYPTEIDLEKVEDLETAYSNTSLILWKLYNIHKQGIVCRVVGMADPSSDSDFPTITPFFVTRKYGFRPAYDRVSLAIALAEADIQGISLVEPQLPGKTPYALRIETKNESGVKGNRFKTYYLFLLDGPIPEEPSYDYEQFKAFFNWDKEAVASLVWTEHDSASQKIAKAQRLFQLAEEGRLLLAGPYLHRDEKDLRMFAEKIGKNGEERKSILRIGLHFLHSGNIPKLIDLIDPNDRARLTKAKSLWLYGFGIAAIRRDLSKVATLGAMQKFETETRQALALASEMINALPQGEQRKQLEDDYAKLRQDIEGRSKMLRDAIAKDMGEVIRQIVYYEDLIKISVEQQDLRLEVLQEAVVSAQQLRTALKDGALSLPSEEWRKKALGDANFFLRLLKQAEQVKRTYGAIPAIKVRFGYEMTKFAEASLKASTDEKELQKAHSKYVPYLLGLIANLPSGNMQAEFKNLLYEKIKKDAQRLMAVEDPTPSQGRVAVALLNRIPEDITSQDYTILNSYALAYSALAKIPLYSKKYEAKAAGYREKAEALKTREIQTNI